MDENAPSCDPETIIEVTSAELEQLTGDRDAALAALAHMVEQYCQWKDKEIGVCYFHMFMGAGEHAFEVLELAGLLQEVKGELYTFTEEGERVLANV